MNHKIHIFGASGAGTTTLGQQLSRRLDIPHFDTDDYYWIKTEIPYTESREINQRIELLSSDLEKYPSWILSGSLCNWGKFTIPLFTLAVLLWIPQELRISRLKEREIERYGLEAISPGGWFYEHHIGFMEWAEQYDTAGIDLRSRALHEEWMKKLQCKIIRFEEPLSVDELAAGVEEVISG